MPAELPPQLNRVLSLAHVDLAPAHRQPAALRVVAASLVSVAGSLAADSVLVALSLAVFPSTRGYVHFRFSDYAKLTVIGVVIACLAWPLVTRISSAPRWLFLRMAVLVTLVLWLPDLYILANGQPPRAVAVLIVMHLAIALVTYNSLVRIAPVTPTGPGTTPASSAEPRHSTCTGAPAGQLKRPSPSLTSPLSASSTRVRQMRSRPTSPRGAR